MDQLSKRSDFLNEIEQLWNELSIRCTKASSPGSNTGEMRAQDFEAAIGDMRIRAYFRRIGLFIETYNSNALFRLLDTDHDGILNFNDFAIGCEQLRGEAQKLDMTRLRI